MVFTHDTAAALQSAVALVNTADHPDTLTTVEALAEFYAEHEYSGGHARDEAELEAVRAVRAPVRELLTSHRDAAVELVNTILADAVAVPRLVRHDRLDWHIHAIADEAPLAERIMVETAMAMIDVIRADELNRLATCAADDCAGLVLDLSRNRSRRYCSTGCGNREAVAAYRARQRA
ncbi:CGNR zinc finger domain-containing protein [Nocardioides piscis]|uniref:CGNR zinc finger domain-containing protein n=1 Tax=Nocardioides piscis TaxID=2714938 RepID=A0A6G7YGS0_9ACTN|nr:CGNR zinc finger domain-containing protein [Nocardioides piscis]QIK75929.1 CGNR zinc finger domain-containing protein [Nocardioides piscis]